MKVFNDQGKEISLQELQAPSQYKAPASRIIPLLQITDSDHKENNEFVLVGTVAAAEIAGRARVAFGGAVEQKESFEGAMVREYEEELFHSLIEKLSTETGKEQFPHIIKKLAEKGLKPSDLKLFPRITKDTLRNYEATFHIDKDYVLLTSVAPMKLQFKEVLLMLEHSSLLAQLCNEQRKIFLEDSNLPDNFIGTGKQEGKIIKKDSIYYGRSLREHIAKQAYVAEHPMVKACKKLQMITGFTELSGFGLVKKAELAETILKWKQNGGKEKCVNLPNALDKQPFHIDKWGCEDALPLIQYSTHFAKVVNQTLAEINPASSENAVVLFSIAKAEKMEKTETLNAGDKNKQAQTLHKV